MLPILIAAFSGLILSVLVESRLEPVPRWRRPFSAWAVHLGVWLFVYALLVLLLGRPWFSIALISAFILVLVQVNNAKMKSLCEPFVYQDFEYFTDAIRHPRLYIPFLGWGKFFIAVAGFTAAVVIGYFGEAVPDNRFALDAQGGVILVLLISAVLLIEIGRRYLPAQRFEPLADVTNYGLIASLWAYGAACIKHPSMVVVPFAIPPKRTEKQSLPHLVVVQSESFFDARRLYSGIRSEVLSTFDVLKRQSLMHGKLDVPAWGANTVRTEFSFLTGIDGQSLDVHRFNPYRAVAAGWEVDTIASYLKSIGYRTVCVHPYPASFYLRDRVYPKLGFDTFLDIAEFKVAELAGQYISDLEVARKIIALLHEGEQPVFIYAITMENHGPLHLESATQQDAASFYKHPPPDGVDDLTIYLRHLNNADAMIGVLMDSMKNLERQAGLCWYGDHVPIMPKVYEMFGLPDGYVDYAIWHNNSIAQVMNRDIAVSQLPFEFLKVMGLLSNKTEETTKV